MITANQPNGYYDIWALRHESWMPFDCWKMYMKEGTKEAFKYYILDRFIKIIPFNSNDGKDLSPTKEKSSNNMHENLKLVLMNDQNDQHSVSNVKNDDQLFQQHSKKRRKRKAKAKNIDSATDSTFTINTEDPRFSAMYNDSNYAIDPTDSKFKATENMKKILTAKSKMNQNFN